MITAILSLTLGAFVYYRGRKSIINLSFALMSLSIFVWSFGVSREIVAQNIQIGLFWNRFLYIGAISIPVFFLHFVLSLLNLHVAKRRLLVVAYLITLIFWVLDFTPLFVKGVVPKGSFNYASEPGLVYPFFLAFFFLCVSYSHYSMIKVYHTSSGLKRNQIKYLLVATLIAFFGGATNFLLVFSLIKTPPLGNYFVSIYTLILAYAIVKHRLMDINIVIKKGATYAFLIIFLLIPSLVLTVFAQKHFFGSINYPFSFIILALFVLATFIFPKFKPGTEKTIEQLLFKGKYDYKKTLSDLSKAMISILDKDTLLAKIINTTTEAMQVEKASILLLNEDKGYYRMQSSRGLDKVKEKEFQLISSGPLIIWLREKGEIVVKEELERSPDKLNIPDMATFLKRLNDMESEVCIPLITRQKLIGIYNIGKKMNGNMFSHEDLAMLETLGNQAAVAIENARLYEDLKKSEAQMRRADRLAALGTLTAGLAHEIRNPLVAIKTFTQLLPERFDDIEFRDHFLKVTSGEVDRICSLVNELLEFARPSEPNFHEDDINDVAEKIILLVDNEAKKKDIKINREYDKKIPPIMIDKEQIKQVLLNLFLNAIEATSENGIITFETGLIHKNNHRDYVQIKIHDTGEGISEDDLEQIFTPFFTTKDKGSGLGLSISYKIVEEHMGHIEVKSKVGNGSTFYVYLPLTPDRNNSFARKNLPVVNKTRGNYSATDSHR